jgi:hypothetical protein
MLYCSLSLSLSLSLSPPTFALCGVCLLTCPRAPPFRVPSTTAGTTESKRFRSEVLQLEKIGVVRVYKDFVHKSEVDRCFGRGYAPDLVLPEVLHFLWSWQVPPGRRSRKPASKSKAMVKPNLTTLRRIKTTYEFVRRHRIAEITHLCAHLAEVEHSDNISKALTKKYLHPLIEHQPPLLKLHTALVENISSGKPRSVDVASMPDVKIPTREQTRNAAQFAEWQKAKQAIEERLHKRSTTPATKERSSLK